MIALFPSIVQTSYFNDVFLQPSLQAFVVVAAVIAGR
jgi:hypothetical protein